MNIATLLYQSAMRRPDAPAIGHGDEIAYTYAELAGTASAVGRYLEREHDLRPGDRIALAMNNTPHYLAVLFAAWWTGLIVVPMNPRLHRREFEQLVADSGAALCVTTADLSAPETVPCLDVVELCGAAGEAEDTPPPAVVAPEDPAWLFYTSGTTGRSKGATLTHRNLMAATLSALADLGDAADASLLHLTPMSHAGGLFGIVCVARARTNVLPRDGVVDAATLAEALTAFGPVTFFAVPTILRRLLDPKLLPDELIARVRRIYYGGAPTYVDDLRRVVARFGAQRLWQAFGQGESPCTITHLTPEEHLDLPGDGDLMTVGHARTGVQVEVVGPDGEPLPHGEVGEVVVRGDTVMAGYWRDPEATEATLRRGRLHTGDLGRLDSRGRLTLVDRAKDLIISGGSNIYPREIEESLLSHPAVAEAAVVGRPDAEWGELPVAFLVTTTEVTPDELDAHCLNLLARYKRPRDYHFVSALPRNGYGKVRKTELRTRISPQEGPR
ncbi:acyl-CoA synthetase (AMP-forming)/AMP-acid ligase II [Nocardia tenerifensis]|uniref:Acyl-CoA synthetase (AMP-forming)/AMP-acid ligase II n=1 Tax=Nocardia tenerifensis TaxID=228006 RepID=A0A318JXL9_9NOCA|nr:AMP-binding protein [Nocardia tenerifensis]PXX58410.1 acyl-CoA synthetase (AMP-forming)/AMP-acid ligase II [Nocardia tenerifensis]